MNNIGTDGVMSVGGSDGGGDRRPRADRNAWPAGPTMGSDARPVSLKVRHDLDTIKRTFEVVVTLAKQVIESLGSTVDANSVSYELLPPTVLGDEALVTCLVTWRPAREGRP
jgi:hypothetical protein